MAPIDNVSLKGLVSPRRDADRKNDRIALLRLALIDLDQVENGGETPNRRHLKVVGEGVNSMVQAHL